MKAWKAFGANVTPIPSANWRVSGFLLNSRKSGNPDCTSVSAKVVDLSFARNPACSK